MNNNTVQDIVAQLAEEGIKSTSDWSGTEFSVLDAEDNSVISIKDIYILFQEVCISWEDADLNPADVVNTIKAFLQLPSNCRGIIFTAFCAGLEAAGDINIYDVFRFGAYCESPHKNTGVRRNYWIN